MDGLKERLLALGQKIVPGGRFTLSSSMTNLPEWTSLVHIQLLGEVAHAFDIDIDLDDAYRLDSFERLLAHIRKQREAKAAQPDYPFSSIGALFHEQARRHPTRPFLIFPKEDLELDYQRTRALAAAAADILAASGLGKGDRLCLVLPNGPEFLLYYFAAHLLGVVLVPINPVLSAGEMEFIIDNCGARLTLLDASLQELGKQLKPRGEDCRLVVADGSSGFGLAALEAAASGAPSREPRADIGLDDDAVILYTSGTTGKPKGVVLTQRNFLADAWALVDWFGFADRTRTLCVLPMFHNNGQVITLLSPLWVGGSTVIMQSRSALMSFWKMIARYQVQWTSVMPAFLTAFLEYKLPRTDSSLEGIVCGGQVLLDEVRSRFEEHYQVAVFEGYGLTETTSFSSLNRYPAQLRKFGSIGVALPCNEMKIVDDQGKEKPHGETGQILIKGENVARAYHLLAEVTAERFRDGWLHTGDYGSRDADGNFYFSTRLDDLIIKGGENIYPAELENVLQTCDEIAECAAVGVPDPILGQEIAVYVKLREGSAFDAERIRDYCRSRIAAFKQPRHVFVLGRDAEMTELPKGPTRKILRRRLRDHFLERQASPTAHSAPSPAQA